MSQYMVAMQSTLRICEYNRPDRWLRSNTEFVILAGSGTLDPYLVIGVGPKSRGDEIAAPDDLKALHVKVATRVAGNKLGMARTYLLNRHLPDDLELPAFFRSAQFFPADGTVEVVLSNGVPSLSVLGRHAHHRDQNNEIIEVHDRGMRSRVHIEGRVTDVRAALTWQFTGKRLPWSLEQGTGG
ncbi:MAG: hypothetical protein KF849_16455 [Rhizobiaceae bacterium]|nr:hypothetical protein [Rhizobiaceae bacterium]